MVLRACGRAGTKARKKEKKKILLADEGYRHASLFPDTFSEKIDLQ